MGKGAFFSKLFRERLEGFSEEELSVFFEACALSLLQISILQEYFESSEERKNAFENLKRRGLISPYKEDSQKQ